MAHFVLLLIGAAVVGLIGFGVTWMIAGRDRGLGPEEPDGAAVPLPNARPLEESDIETVRFDTTARGYRMGQVDAALRRVAYDIGYKQELINVLEAENEALRDGRMDDANALRDARNSATAARPSGPFAATSHAAHGDAAHASHADASHAVVADASGADDPAEIGNTMGDEDDDDMGGDMNGHVDSSDESHQASASAGRAK